MFILFVVKGKLLAVEISIEQCPGQGQDLRVLKG
jgi:hypothetical protein